VAENINCAKAAAGNRVKMIDRKIRELVASAPPLTEKQRATIRAAAGTLIEIAAVTTDAA
jgi:hypothetical protein